MQNETGVNCHNRKGIYINWTKEKKANCNGVYKVEKKVEKRK